MNYKVYQGDELKQTVTDKIAVMNGLQPNQSYVFGVQPDDGQTGAVGANLIAQSDFKYGYLDPNTGDALSTTIDFYSDYIATNGETVFTFSSPDYVFKGSGNHTLAMYDSNKNYLGYQPLDSATQTLSKPNVAYIRFSINFTDEGGTTASVSDWLANHRYKLEKGSVATMYVSTTSVTTRGIRFNVPKTLTVGSNIALRYEEYPLGIVPIGNEPSGCFGGGNKQSLSAKVISAANGSSVVEVGGNVIEVGNKNLWDRSKVLGGWLDASSGVPTPHDAPDAMIPDPITIPAGAKSLVMTTYNPNKVSNTYSSYRVCFFNGSTFIGPQTSYFLTGDAVQTIKWDITAGADKVYLSAVLAPDGSGVHDPSIHIKYEFGDTATPYAAFVDGDTFTAQPDGTCALFSEHKALYY